MSVLDAQLLDEASPADTIVVSAEEGPLMTRSCSDVVLGISDIEKKERGATWRSSVHLSFPSEEFCRDVVATDFGTGDLRLYHGRDL